MVHRCEVVLSSVNDDDEQKDGDCNVQHWRRQAVQEGIPNAACRLADAYYCGTHGLTRNATKAVQWYQHAANREASGNTD